MENNDTRWDAWFARNDQATEYKAEDEGTDTEYQGGFGDIEYFETLGI